MRKALFTALILSGCMPRPQVVQPPPPAALPAPVELVAPADWPVLSDDLPPESLSLAAERSLVYLKGLGDKTFRLGDRSVSARLLADSVSELARTRREAKTPEELNALLRERFDLFRVSGATLPPSAFFSGYYQPELEASRKRTEEYRYPLYRKPADMVVVDLGAFHSKFKGETIVGRVRKGEFVPYFSRRDIDARAALAGKGYEIAWLKNQFDRLDIHVQGSGLLKFPDGKVMLAKYAATNALPYRSVGLAVLGSGAMTREQLNHETLRRYLTEHPEGESWLLAQNPRYTFFDLAPLPGDGEPYGSIQQQLVAGRSIAVDPKVVPLGAVAYMALPLPQADRQGRLLAKAPTSRFVLCQDTGGAIQGPGRVDIYVGHGPQAKAMAVNIWDAGSLYLLVKKLPPRER